MHKENDAAESSPRYCPACGTGGHRGQAQFCVTCGRELEDTAYLPSDTLRASYHMQHRGSTHLQYSRVIQIKSRSILPKVSTPNRNGASSTAMAFVTYALVPYLGILFCPGAVLMAGVGLIRSWRVPHLGGRNTSYAGLGLGIAISSAQVFLWWILYKVPQWATGVDF